MRVSFVQAPLLALGGIPQAVGEALAVLRLPGERPQAPVVLSDLSPFARIGFKGADTPHWLTTQGLFFTEAPNQATRQADGSLVARLSAGEFLILSQPGDNGGWVAALDAAWSWASEAGLCFPLPRQDSHAWFHLRGEAVPQMFAKLCGVDLRRHVFADGAIAQTSVARTNGIIIRDGEDYHLLADSASAEYLWDCLIDAMGEFDGSIVGAASLLK